MMALLHEVELTCMCFVRLECKYDGRPKHCVSMASAEVTVELWH